MLSTRFGSLVDPRAYSSKQPSFRAEQERIKEAKRKRLLAKAEERRKNLARFLEVQREQRERFRCVILICLLILTDKD